MTDTTQAPAIVPDELVKAADELVPLYRSIFIDREIMPDDWFDAVSRATIRLSKALALPRRTEADIRADERERLAKLIEREETDLSRRVKVSAFVNWLRLRSQGGE
jgi:hypothetical protein